MSNSHNAFLVEATKTLGPALLCQEGGFNAQMVALESVTATLLMLLCITHNRQPDEAVAVFNEVLAKRLHALVYGEQRH